MQHTERSRTGPAPRLDRREFLKAGTAAAAIAVAGGALIHAGEAWGLEVKTLQPTTVRTLILMARDIYPHDRLADKYYAIAIKPWDLKAAQDATTRTMIEDGVATLDGFATARHRRPYVDVAWEADRVFLLRHLQDGAFFETVRGGLIVSLYNQHEIWPLFGYEGESASKGGYIHRGFNDLEWL